MKRTPLSLSDQQLRMIRAAAAALPVNARDEFLQSIARHLAGEPSDTAITQAINVVLDLTPVFLCDSAQQKEAIMARQRHDDDDDDAPRSRAVIPDGGSVRVKMHMMDGMDPVQKAIATQLHDGHGGGIGHKPGHIVSGASEALDVRRQMYDEYDARMATEYLGAVREGTICTVRNAQYPRAQGAPGQVQNGICVPDDDELRDALPARDSNMTLDALEAQHRRNMADVYVAYDARIREMWRNP